MPTLRLRYQTIEFGELDIHLRMLRDNQQFSDPDGVAERLGISSAAWPLFGIVWASSEVLAHLMFEFEIAGKRILEVGCGIGLASLVLNHRLADITATDHHPAAADFLRRNVALNDGDDIPFVRTGWADEDSSLGRFDLIIGSDLLYERAHVALLAAFIQRHARSHCEVVLVDPGRGHHAQFSKRMIALGYSHSQSRPSEHDYQGAPFKGQVLRYAR
ncbi:MAG: methyltransferase domain-containing protein [Sedimenticolaceae bacterium]|nr:methyltransferase domain-containing protein [Chromatiaceae bacterium]HPE79018.1 methyltransferase domain-containing protein [Gammaproteobacteria bacterium]